ncbi:hypothetical protein Anas_00535 [Armadillidium nasatum]|uniref:Uncharacterized protein n=1 Tax=Armadillidium nasatum TaxID=96803 RepID=A0A5N5SXK6_9CRUS|nr:hypothetical protein Anas_00535 [Armadillidium nasatum]
MHRKMITYNLDILWETFRCRRVYFHVVGEGVVNVSDRRHQAVEDKENYIDFRMRLLGEPDPRYPPAEGSEAPSGM